MKQKWRKEGRVPVCILSIDCQIINHMTGEPTETTSSSDTKVWFGKAVEVSVQQTQTGFKYAFLSPTSFQSTSLTPITNSTGPDTYHLCSLKPGSRFATKHKTDIKSSTSRWVCFTYEKRSFCSNIQNVLLVEPTEMRICSKSMFCLSLWTQSSWDKKRSILGILTLEYPYYKLAVMTTKGK